MLMFKPCQNFLLLPPKIFTTNSKPHLHHHLHHHHHDVKLHCSSLKAHFKSTSLSSSPPPPPDLLSLTTSTIADFLMESGGLSYVEAMQVIRKVPSLLQDGGRKPRSVIAYFESIGFSKIQISQVISNSPGMLAADVEKTLKPKIQLFQDFGFSESGIADLIASRTGILHSSLKAQIKPGLDLIKRYVKTDEALIKSLKRNGHLLLRSIPLRNSIEPNIDVLKQHGVPDSEIVHLILLNMSALMSTPKVFKTIVQRIASLGFKPETRKFSNAVVVMSGMKKATWDSKIDLLKGLGWSDEHILDAFRRSPRVLTLSCERLKEGIEFYKESLNWDASFLTRNPFILNYSLKRRVIPRLAVLKCLMSKEIIKDNKRFIYVLRFPETEFLSKYVFRYQDQLPDLYTVYKKECMLGCEEDNGQIANLQDHGDVDMTV